MMDVNFWATIFSGLVVVFYIICQVIISCCREKGLKYWKERGVVGSHPHLIIDQFSSVFRGKKAPFQILAQVYEDYRDFPYVGTFKYDTPVFIIIEDFDLIEKVLIGNFKSFRGRGDPVDDIKDPLSTNIFSLQGPRWSVLRQKFTHLFKGDNMREMIELIFQCCDDFGRYLDGLIGSGGVIECKEPLARFTINVVRSCFFGATSEELDYDDNEWRRISRKVLKHDRWLRTKIFWKEILCKRIAKEINTANQPVNNFFLDNIRKIIAQRERKNEQNVNGRNDLIDILIDMKKETDADNKLKFTDADLAAQALVFFAAGFETTSSTISFALLELAHAHEIQERLRCDISQGIDKFHGLTYEMVGEMEYLDMIIQETLRKNLTPVLTRQANEDYKVTEDIIIEKGTIVKIPTYAIHHDPKYFPDPETFNPERFTKEAKNSRHRMLHLPFGGGPKNCIASRFALLLTKVAIIKILMKYHIESTELTPIRYKIDPIESWSGILTIKNGVHLRFDPVP